MHNDNPKVLFRHSIHSFKTCMANIINFKICACRFSVPVPEGCLPLRIDTIMKHDISNCYLVFFFVLFNHSRSLKTPIIIIDTVSLYFTVSILLERCASQKSMKQILAYYPVKWLTTMQ